MSRNLFVLVSIVVLFRFGPVSSANSTEKVKQSINEYPYKFLHKPDCYNDDGEFEASMKLTIVVKSSVLHFKKRMAIRETWGFEQQLWPDVAIRTVFNLGLSNHAYFRDQIDIESEVFQDIIQSNFMDSYYNNTLKTVMGMQWAVQTCKLTDFFFFVDDDFVVSIENLINLIKENKYNKYTHLYLGHIHAQSVPFRDPTHKWYVSTIEFPDDVYPPFAAGGAVLYSRTGLQLIRKGISNSKHFRLDDVFIGIAAKKSGVGAIHNEHFRMYHKINLTDYSNFKSTIASHGFGDIDEMVNVWNVFTEAR